MWPGTLANSASPSADFFALRSNSPMSAEYPALAPGRWPESRHLSAERGIHLGGVESQPFGWRHAIAELRFEPFGAAKPPALCRWRRRKPVVTRPELGPHPSRPLVKNRGARLPRLNAYPFPRLCGVPDYAELKRRTSFVRGRSGAGTAHSHNASRKASKRSDASNRRGLRPGSATRRRAASFMARSAST